MNHENSPFALAQARIRHELQLQQPVAFISRDDREGLLFAAEFVDEALWERFANHKPKLILSPARARILGHTASGALSLKASNLTFFTLTQLIAGRGEASPVVTPSAQPLPEADALIALVKQTGLIPALIFVEGMPRGNHLQADSATVCAAVPADVIRGETVALPIDGATHSTLTSFRGRYDTAVHLALVIGDITKAPPLVRVHSSCVTGDLLGSLRCDCGNQLQQALSVMKEEACGVLLYLHQEGRGIGITSKLRAYALQEQGFDTFAANELLGFEEDERDFSVATVMLSSLGVGSIRLLTNNPDKIEAFAAGGITVAGRVALSVPANAHNHAYIKSKKTKRGHL